MRYSNQVKPISYLKSHAAKIIRELSAKQEPLLITQNGEAKLVVMDVRSYEKLEETLALFKILSIGQKQIEQKKFRDITDVFNDIEKG